MAVGVVVATRVSSALAAGVLGVGESAQSVEMALTGNV